MSVPIRDSSGQADAERATSAGRLPPSQVVRNLAALEQSLGLYSLPDHILRRLARKLRPIDMPAEATVLAQGARGDRTDKGRDAAIPACSPHTVCGLK